MGKYIDAFEFHAKFDAVIKASHDLIDAMIALNSLHAVTGQEVKHGRWIEQYHRVYCSECESSAPYVFKSNKNNVCDYLIAYGEYQKTPYCPSCGAKMDEEEITKCEC